jgi:AraC-like DNA-binding protein
LEVKEICLRVGYESASSFSNAFKRWHGCCPADFRASAACGENERTDPRKQREASNSGRNSGQFRYGVATDYKEG